MAQATLTAAPVQSGNMRVRKVHSLQELFPEAPELKLEPVHRDQVAGFAEPGKCVPSRIHGFIQTADFVRKFSSAYRSPRSYVITLFGPTGAGKTDRVLDFFSRLNIPVLHLAVNAKTADHHLVGSQQLVESDKGVVTQFRDGILVKAMRAGCPLLLDEAYKLSPSITSRLHTVRDKGELLVYETGETVVARPGFKLICTSNQTGYGDMTGMHPGDEAQDAAWLNGSVRIKCDYLPEDLEKQLVAGYLKTLDPAFERLPQLVEKWTNGLVSVAQKIRALSTCNLENVNAFSSDRMEVVCSTRDLMNICWYAVDLKGAPGSDPIVQAFDLVMLDAASQTTRVAVDAWLLSELAVSRA